MVIVIDQSLMIMLAEDWWLFDVIGCQWLMAACESQEVGPSWSEDLNDGSTMVSILRKQLVLGVLNDWSSKIFFLFFCCAFG